MWLDKATRTARRIAGCNVHCPIAIERRTIAFGYRRDATGSIPEYKTPIRSAAHDGFKIPIAGILVFRDKVQKILENDVQRGRSSRIDRKLGCCKGDIPGGNLKKVGSWSQLGAFKGAVIVAPRDKDDLSLLHFAEDFDDCIAKRTAHCVPDAAGQISGVFRISRSSAEENKDAE